LWLCAEKESDSLVFHPYDIFVLAVLAAATLYGLWKGVAWQVASIASLVISAVVAGRYGAALAPYLSNQAPWNRFLAMLILYLATSAGIWMLFHVVARLIDRIQLRDFDCQLGAILGFAKGLLLCVVVTFFAVTLSESARQSILHSLSGYYMAKLIHNAGPLLPREVRDVLGKYVDELDHKLDPATPPDKSAGDRLQDRLPDGLPGPLREQLQRGSRKRFRDSIAPGEAVRSRRLRPRLRSRPAGVASRTRVRRRRLPIRRRARVRGPREAADSGDSP
jgi:membrane protein required for colicin V production